MKWTTKAASVNECVFFSFVFGCYVVVSLLKFKNKKKRKKAFTTMCGFWCQFTCLFWLGDLKFFRLHKVKMLRLPACLPACQQPFFYNIFFPSKAIHIHVKWFLFFGILFSSLSNFLSKRFISITSISARSIDLCRWTEIVMNINSSI